MLSWIYIGAAIGANVLLNVFLKKTVSVLPPTFGVETVRQAVMTPAAWGFAACAILAVGFYALAIRSIDLSIAYASVTSLALIGVTIAGALIFRETVSAVNIVGVALIIVGIILVTKS